MEKRKLSALCIAFLVMTANSSPTPTVITQTTDIGNHTANMTIPHNDRFVFLLPFLGVAVSELAAALGIAAAVPVAVAGGVAAGQAISEAIKHSGSSGGSSGGSYVSKVETQTYEGLLSKASQVLPQTQTEIAPMLVSLTALQSFTNCNSFGPCVGVSPGLFGPKMYMGVLVEKGECPNFTTDQYGKIVALVSKVIDSKLNLLTTKATIQFPFLNCNKECCMLKRNLLKNVCFGITSRREGQCMDVQCSSDKEEIKDSSGCDVGQKCCGHHSAVLLG